MKRLRLHMMLLMLCVLCMQGCALIDDDLTVCGKDFQLELQMELQTSLDLELQTVLTAETDVSVRQVLHDYFSNIFTDHAHDINIGFFSTLSEELVYSIHDVIDANQSTYTFYLPKDDYYAIALANLDSNEVVFLEDSLNSRMARLVTLNMDTLPTQRTGLFTVAREIAVSDTADQVIDLTLHMVNSAVAILIDTTGVPVQGFRGFLSGTAEQLMLRDSLFLYDHPRMVRMEEVTGSQAAAPNRARRVSLDEDSVTYAPEILACTSMPSADVADKDGAYYKAWLYTTLPDGKVTQTVFSLKEPLKAGQLKIIRSKLQPGGDILPTSSSEVGVTVTLDWKSGGEHNIDF